MDFGSLFSCRLFFEHETVESERTKTPLWQKERANMSEKIKYIVVGLYPHFLLYLKVVVLDMITIEFSYYLRVKFHSGSLEYC